MLVSAEYNHFLKEGSYYGDEGLTDMYLIKHEWGKALYNMVNTHNFFSMYRLIRKRVKRIGMDIEDIPENMEVRTKYNEYGIIPDIIIYLLPALGQCPITYGITR